MPHSDNIVKNIMVKFSQQGPCRGSMNDVSRFAYDFNGMVLIAKYEIVPNCILWIVKVLLKLCKF